MEAKGLNKLKFRERNIFDGHDDHGHDDDGHKKKDDHDDHDDGHKKKDDHGHDDDGHKKKDDHDDHDDHEGRHHGEYDPHIWLDPINAKQF